MSFFFFRQKTGNGVLRSLVGSEVCIRDRPYSLGVLHTFEGGGPPPPSESVQKSTEAL